MNAKAILLLVVPMFLVVSGRNLKKDQCENLPDDTLIANPKGCKYFFSCKGGVSVGAYCPHGLWFNPNPKFNRNCELPEHVECHFNDPITTTTTTKKPNKTPTASTHKTTIGTTTTTTTTPTSTATTTTKSPPVKPDPGKVVCPTNDSNAIQFVSSPINCRQYYICYHGSPMRQECINGLHWNTKTNKCDQPNVAQCNVSSARPLPKCPKNGSRFFPHPTECDYYIYCRNGFHSIQQCPFYHHWDVTTESCRWSRSTHCPTAAEPQHRQS